MTVKVSADLIEIIVAGAINCPEARELTALPNCTYYGQLSNVESLALYAKANLVFSYYDPSFEINRKAEPNKWFDCVFTGTPFVTNDEVETADVFRREQVCFSLPYSDDDGLAELLIECAADRQRLLDIEWRLKQIELEPWDLAMKELIVTFLDSAD